MKRSIINLAPLSLAIVLAGCADASPDASEPELADVGIGELDDRQPATSDESASSHADSQHQRLHRCTGCGPVPDPWKSIAGPVPDPWDPDPPADSAAGTNKNKGKRKH